MAAMKGVDLDEGQGSDKFEEVKQKVQAELTGKSEEQNAFEMIGIEFESDDDEDAEH